MNISSVSKEIVKSVGGKKNIKSVTHCVTRLRFVLNDFTLPNKDTVSSIDGVISVIEQGGQYQVVVGNKVNDLYEEIKNEIGDLNDLETDFSSEKRGNPFETFTATISGIFTPVLGPLAASGTIKGILAILQTANILSDSSGTYTILFALSNAFFYFMPVILGASAARYFKMNTYVGMIIGASLIYPSLIPFASEGGLNFIGIPVNVMDYTSSVFPVIVAVWLASKIDKQATKMPLKDLKFILQPMIVLLLAVPITLIAIGPIISNLSEALATGVNVVYDFSPIIGGAVIGGPWILLVMFGLHWAFIPIFINNIASQGFDPIMGLLLANQFAMAGASFAVGIKTKNEKLRALSYSTGVTTLIGVSEPTLYGVLLPYKKPLISAILGGSIGAIFAGAANTVQYAFGGSGLLGIPLFINPNGIDIGFYGGIASQIIGLVSAFIITYFWGFKDKTEGSKNIKEQDSLNAIIDPKAIVKGEVKSLSEVPDKVFSEGMMGQGVAILPSSNEISSPFDGTVSTVFPTRHAIGLTSKDGVELLIHVGIDTVELKGKYFETMVTQGQAVKKGDILLRADFEKISEAGFSKITAIIVTNTDDFNSVTIEEDQLRLEKQ